jgi:primosomal replication protein N
MLLSPSVFSPTTPERFDTNQAEICGMVTKIWARSSGDVYVRVMISECPPAQDDTLEGRAFDTRLTLLLPKGQVNGQDLSLLRGDLLHVNGYLADITQWETMRDFLLKARQPGLVERVPELAPALGVRLKRVLTCVIPETLEVLGPAAQKVTLQGSARLEGVVARVWQYGGDLFTRLAVYDQHTLMTSLPGNHGRMRRVPHYLTVQFPGQRVDGRQVSLKQKDRLRVSGSLGSRVYSENLRSFLISAGEAARLAQLSDGQAPDEVWTVYVQTCLVAHTLIQYTRR